MTVVSASRLRAFGGNGKSARGAAGSVGCFAFAEGDMAQAIVPEWLALAAKAAEDNAFFDPDFALPAMAALAGEVRIATWRAGNGGLAALAPVAAARLGGMLPAIRVFAHEYGPLGLPLVDDATADGSVAGLLGGLLESGGSLILPEMPLDGPVVAAVSRFAADNGRPLATVHAYRRAMLTRPGADAVDCRAMLPARRRKEYARQMRRLADLGDVAIESAGEPDHVRQRFEEFLALEAGGWKGRRGTALATRSEIAAMARGIVASLAERDKVRIDSIRLGARPVAMLISFLCGETACSWKIAFDESYARFSPGAQLMLEAGRALLAVPGIRRVDSCATADHQMIDHLWAERRAIATLVVGPVGGSRLHSAGLAALRAETAARAVAKRLGGRTRRILSRSRPSL